MKQRRGGKSWALLLSQAHAHVISPLWSPEKKVNQQQTGDAKARPGAMTELF